jgi:tRNA threonylcarbamoyladenosine biosynthesis protein TsaE
MSEYVSHSTEETESFAAALADRLRAGDVIALYGGLGAGKTAFVRGLARGLGTTSEVSSPTFALVHEYDGRLQVAHFDMYRIHTSDDLYSTGFFDYLDSGCVCVIEWSENIEEDLPDRVLKIRITRGETENERTLTIEDETTGR